MQKYLKDKQKKLMARAKKVKQHSSPKKIDYRRKIVLTLISIMFVISVYFIFNYLTTPGTYDSFARCLTDKGAIMYGEDWCKYTNAQKSMFGKSFKFIDYRVKTDLRLRPTWIINNKKYEGVQSFESLSKATNCKIYGGNIK
jgi:hypothetical protein